MKKFGQITIFIILGVILISIFLLLIYVKKSIFDVNNLIIPSQVKPVEVYVDSCISKLSKEALIELQNGRINHNDFFLNEDLLAIEYYYDGYTNTMPDIVELEEEFSIYIEDNLNGCVSEFKIEGYSIDYGVPLVKTSFLQNMVDISVNYEINIIKGDSNYKISEFMVSYPIKFLEIYQLANEIVEGLVESEGLLDPDLIGNLEDNYLIYTSPLKDYGGIIEIIDQTSPLDDEYYVLRFAYV